MNTWAQENYQMGMSPIMPPSILPPPMMMQEMNVPPLNPPPIPLLTSITTEDMNIVTDDMSDTNVTCHDVSSNETRNHRSRSRDRSLRRDKDHQGIAAYLYIHIYNIKLNRVQQIKAY